ncbi:hypothetical protein DL96DRAFT_1821509 [Flagelloscypha sp. PMI_526]|nr:hypothetical protein DL96DRAFT_1821509 [Flagelloscypha sp. PMI_526]
MASDLLPYEVIRPLLELAASQDQFTAFSLSLVSWDVNDWVTKILYYSIHLHVSGNSYRCPVRKLLETLTNLNPLLRLRVRHLHITGSTQKSSHIGRLLSIFRGTTTLVSLSIMPNSPYVTPLDVPLPTSLTSLTIESWGLCQMIPNLSDLHFLTDLHIISVEDKESRFAALNFPSTLAQITTLRHLKRVAVSFPPLGESYKAYESFPQWTRFGILLVWFMSTRPSIEMFVLAFYAEAGFEGRHYIPTFGFELWGPTDRIVVVGDQGLKTHQLDTDMLLLPNGFESSAWTDMSSWEATYQYMLSRNGKRI